MSDRSEGSGLRGTMGAVCRGSWMLGTACGSCDHCAQEAPRAVAALREANEQLTRFVSMMVRIVPPPCPATVKPGYDYVDAFKVRMFDAMRAQLYDEQGGLRG